MEFIAGLRGTLLVTFEGGTWATWLYGLLKPHVARLVVCDPCKSRLLKQGDKATVLGKIPEAGTRRRAEQLYQQLDILQHLQPQTRRELLAESRQHTIPAQL